MRNLVLLRRDTTRPSGRASAWPVAVARLFSALLFPALPFLGGCLAHSLMPGCGGSMGHGTYAGDAGHGQHAASAALVKEVQRDDLTVTLEVPPLRAGEEALLTVRVHDPRSGEPLGGARVSIGIESGRRADETGVEEEKGDVVKIGLVGRARAGAETGVYRLAHRFDAAGRYEIRAEVRAGDEGLHRPPVVVVVEQDVAPESSGAGRSKTAMFVLGGVGMALMMGFMLLR